MMQLRKLGAIAGSAALFLGSACVDLDVTNPNNPDIERALASPEDVQALAASAVRSWYLTSTYIEPALPFQVTADASTSNYGNFGMRFNNLEPRIAYENNSAGGDREVARAPWDFNYSTFGAATDAIRAFTTGGIKLETQATTDAYLALARFTQAASMMNLALIFDKAFAIDETFSAELGAPTLVPYKAVSDSAMVMWDKTIAATAGKTFEFPESVLPVTGEKLTMALLGRVSNTMAAATLAYTPRTAAEAATVPWGRVLSYAEKGITSDFRVTGDGLPWQGGKWYSYINIYGNELSWIRVDMRLINRMDPNLPSKFSGSTADFAASTNAAADKRLSTDFTRQATAIGDPGRGIYMQSGWWHSRYYFHARTSSTGGKGSVPYMLKAENDLLIAEALVRTNGDLARAATLINNTRVGRGGLAPVSAASGAAGLLAAIDYERDVELLNTNGFTLFHARHVEGSALDRLQDGTFLHLPIPAKELETLGLPIYTFGGVGKPAMSVGDLAGSFNFSVPTRTVGGLKNPSALR